MWLLDRKSWGLRLFRVVAKSDWASGDMIFGLEDGGVGGVII